VIHKIETSADDVFQCSQRVARPNP